MKKILLSLFLVAGLIHLSSAQTSLTIIGTSHQPIPQFNADTLFNILTKINPDVILMELDTALMNKDGNFKGRAITVKENEEVGAKLYKQFNNKVLLRRFDVEDRGAYYASHKTFATEAELEKAINGLWNTKSLNDSYMAVVAAIRGLDQALYGIQNISIKAINSKAYSQVTELRQHLLYDSELEMIANTSELKKYYDFFKDDGEFWIRRNNRMITNIADYVKEFKGKKIVVLTGATHKYYLTNGLEPLQTKFGFKLNDLPK